MKKENFQIKSMSIGVTATVAVLVISLLFLSFSFEVKKEVAPMLIELDLSESNFGNQSHGNTAVEPLPSEAANIEPPTSSSKAKTETQEFNLESQANTSAPKIPPKTEATTKKSSTQSTQKAETQAEKAPQGDARGKSALENILGGKGSQKSSGEGNASQNGNVGDPKGNSDQGDRIGENWKTRVPANQEHDCQASGTVIVDIVVNSQGLIKRATPRLSSSDCLAQTAKSLVLQYVTAYPGKDNRRGSYRVNLK